MAGAPIITLTNVSFSFGEAPVLSDVNLTVGERDLTCIVGPNGGGKTTLLKLILGLLRPDRGEVRVFGRPPARARAHIGYMPQRVQHDAQFPVTVMDVVLMGRLGERLGGPYSKTDRERARAALAEAGLTDLGGRRFADLSGGQRQRALIARALVGDPALLLLDEPTAFVDPRAEARLFEFLQQLNRRMGILMVTHDLGFVSGVVQSVICVNRWVVVHPTSELRGEMIRDLYGADVRMVRHDHRYGEQEAGHD